jgi:hypothetical protein
MTTPVLADSIMESINVIMNSVNVKINGIELESESILYNGTTYLPLRKVAESVGKDVTWNQETMTADIIEKDLPGVIQSGFNVDNTLYVAKFTDGFILSISLDKEDMSLVNAKDGIVLGLDLAEYNLDAVKPNVVGMSNGNVINSIKYETYSLSIPEELKEQFRKLDFFENFDTNYTGYVYFNDNVDSIYYDDGIHKCKLYFK